MDDGAATAPLPELAIPAARPFQSLLANILAPDPLGDEIFPGINMNPLASFPPQEPVIRVGLVIGPGRPLFPFSLLGY